MESIKAEFLEGVTPKDLAIKYNVDARQIHNKSKVSAYIQDRELLNQLAKELEIPTIEFFI